MQAKKCFKCGLEKEINAFYKHNKMADGHLGKCIACTKKDVRIRERELFKNEVWHEGEKERSRNKYHRLNYKEKHKPTRDYKRKMMKAYFDRYPEKRITHAKTNHIKSVNGNCHHWSYNVEHAKDIFDINKKFHSMIHRYMVYDQERKMYRKASTGELIDTREKAEKYYQELLSTKDII
jgi:hypothetical protein